MDKLFRNLEKLEGLIIKLTLCSKEVLDFEESCKYLDIPYDFLLALSRVGLIPCYNPFGNRLYFRRKDLDNWLLRKKLFPFEEIDQFLGVIPDDNQKKES